MGLGKARGSQLTLEVRTILAKDVRVAINADVLLSNLRDIRTRCHEGPGMDAMVEEAQTYLALIRGTVTDRLRAYGVDVPRSREEWYQLERQLW